ncbi:MAG TPA: DUF6036 family nucleotidyltransferase [Pseudobdellovibrionaceae bacterium]|jgi:hypothetical protein
MLTKEQIKELFYKLNQKLKKQNIRGEIGIVGGAVMCLVFNARVSTKDIDGIFAPTQKIREFIKEIAEEEGVSENWLNDGAKGYIQGDFDKIEVMALSHLAIWAPQPEYMLAMKCISARIDTSDADDVRTLIQVLKLRSAREIFDIVARFYPKQRVPARTQFFIEELFEEGV